MATQPIQDRNNELLTDAFSAIGLDATAAFDPSRNPSDALAQGSSEHVHALPRTPALDEEDEVEDDDPDEDDDLDDEDDDLEDDDEEDEVEEDDDLEDDDDEDEEDDDEDEEEEEEEEDEA